jgi:hypothetical protein
MCVFFDPAAPQQCREPVADLVSDKQRANFCGYFQLNPHIPAGTPHQAVDARRGLDALFGDDSSASASESRGDEDAARDQLDQLFRK